MINNRFNNHALFRYLFIVFFLRMLFSGFAFSENNKPDPNTDFIFKKKIEIEINRSSGAYHANSSVFQEHTYLTLRSTKQNKFMLDESRFAPMSDVKFKMNGRSLSRENVSYGYSQSQDVFISDQKNYTSTIPDEIKIGDKFTISYEQTYKDIAFFPILKIPNVDSLDEYTVVIEYPRNVKVLFDIFFPQEPITISIDSSQQQKRVLSVKSLAHNQSRAFFPFDDARAYIMIVLKNDENIITPSTPQMFTQWYKGLTSLEPVLDSLHIFMLADTLKSVTSSFDKLSIIHNYVRSHVRYVADERGLNSIVPWEPSKIADRNYGDCKDRASLVSAIARAQGINVSMAVVSTEFEPELHYLHPSLFNHMVYAYEESGHTYLFDPTARYSEFGNLPDAEIGADAFVLDAVAPRWETMSVKRDHASMDIRLSAHTDSIDTGTATIYLRDDFLAMARNSLHNLTSDQWKKYIGNFITTNLYQIGLEDCKILIEKETEMVITARANLSKFILKSENKYYIPKTPFLFSNTNLFERANDSLPLYFSSMINLQLTLSITAPGFLSKQEHVSLGDKEWGFLFTGATEERGVEREYSYRLIRQSRKMKAEVKQGFLAFVKEYIDNKKEFFLLMREK